MADLREGPGGPAPPLFLDQTESQKAEKNFIGDRAPSSSQDLDDCPPLAPYLKVWIRH